MLIKRTRVWITAFLVAWMVAAAPALSQTLQDVPPQGVGPGARAASTLDLASRAKIKEAIRKRDYTRAEELLVDAIRARPQSPELLTFLGGVFFLDGKYLNSAVAMKKAEALKDLDDGSRFTLAMAYVKLDHRDWARPELEKLAVSDPRNAFYAYWLSRLDYDAMHYTQCVAQAQKTLLLDSGFMRAYDNLGLCYEALGKHAEAIQSYQRALRLGEEKGINSPWPPLDLGALLLKLGRVSEAEAALREALRHDPNFPQAHFQLGLLLERQRKNVLAVQELQRAASLDPSYPEPHYALGRIYRREGNMTKATLEMDTFQKLKNETVWK